MKFMPSFAPFRIFIVGVPAVDQDVALLKERFDAFSSRVDRGTRANHHHNPSWAFQGSDKFLE
jgi:hypothetical protein